MLSLVADVVHVYQFQVEALQMVAMMAEHKPEVSGSMRSAGLYATASYVLSLNLNNLGEPVACACRWTYVAHAAVPF